MTSGRHRSLFVLVLTLGTAAVLTRLAFRAPYGSDRVTHLTYALAGVLVAGSVLSGGMPRGHRRGRHPVLGPVFTAFVLFAVFAVLAWLAHVVPPVHHAARTLLRYGDARHGFSAWLAPLVAGAAEEVFYRGALFERVRAAGLHDDDRARPRDAPHGERRPDRQRRDPRHVPREQSPDERRLVGARRDARGLDAPRPRLAAAMSRRTRFTRSSVFGASEPGIPPGVSATSLRDQTHLVYRFDAGSDGAVWLARQLCEQWLRQRHVRSDAIPDLLLVTTELCTGVTGDAVLRVGAEGHDVDVEVESAGNASVELPGDDDTTRPSRGDLRLAAALCDEIVLRVTPERTVVRARRHGVVLPD